MAYCESEQEAHSFSAIDNLRAGYTAHWAMLSVTERSTVRLFAEVQGTSDGDDDDVI